LKANTVMHGSNLPFRYWFTPLRSVHVSLCIC
jgi:hypothetical protein